jgi:DNA invertase Pin-like site-specific DNA recombinase
MKDEGLYNPKKNYGNKLNLEKARDIRKKHSDGLAIKELAREYHVTFSTISRIVQNLTYKETTETARVSVIYNIN